MFDPQDEVYEATRERTMATGDRAKLQACAKLQADLRKVKARIEFINQSMKDLGLTVQYEITVKKED